MTHPEKVDPVTEDPQSNFENKGQQSDKAKDSYIGHLKTIIQQIQGIQCCEEAQDCSLGEVKGSKGHITYGLVL